MAASEFTPDQVQTVIVIEAQDAIAALQTLQEEGASLETTIKGLAIQMRATSKEMGVDVDVVKEKWGEMIEEANLFGEFGQKAGMKEVSNEIKDLAKSEEAATYAGQGLFTMTNFLRTAFGTLSAMLIFQVIQAIKTAFQESTKAAYDYYQAIQNITVAQNSMASQGVPVTNQQLLEMADKLRDKFGTFAKVDMTNAVSQAALLSQQYRMSVDQVQQLVEMAATLARLHGGLPQDYVDNLLKGAMGTANMQATQLGLVTTTQDLVAKAKELNLVSQDFTGTLTDQQKATAGLAIEWERLGPQMTKVLQDNNSELAKSATATAKWKDAMLELGLQIAPIWDGIKTFGAGLVTFLQYIPKLIWEIAAQLAAVVIVIDALGKNANEVITHWAQTWQIAINLARQQMQALTSGTGGIDLTNTPTNPNPPPLEGAGATTVAQPNDLNGVMQAYQSYYDQMEKDAQAFSNRMQDMQDQYNLNVQKEIENTNLRIMQTEQDYNLRREAEAQNFHEKMREMQDQYLLELEGALRKRDAEAVISIIEKYRLQTEEAKRQEQIKTSQEAEQEKLRIEQMRQEEQLRLKQMAEEFALQQAQERRNYAQQQQDLAKALDEKLQEEAVKLAQKYNLNEGAADQLYNLFKTYYGPDGLMASKQQAGYLAMEQNTASMIAQMQVYIGQYSSMMSTMLSGMPMPAPNEFGGVGNVPYGPPSPSDQNIYGVPGGRIGPPAPPTSTGGGTSIRRARGGVDLAQSATTVTFGEAGPELAMFLPLNASQAGQIATTGLGSLGLGGNNAGGRLQIEVVMDPDLQARIVNNTLTQASISIRKVARSR